MRFTPKFGAFFTVRDLQPRSFTKIAFTEKLFEVAWLPPVRGDEVTILSNFFRP
jgi:hypothetical protein